MVKNKKSLLSREKNLDCILCPNGKERAENQGKDGYCKITKGHDSLPARCVGPWGQDKIHILATYIGIVGNALKDQQTNYIEICSGPGICINYREGFEFDGNPLAVLKSRNVRFFKNLFFFDYDKNTVAILKERIRTNSEILPEVKEKVIISVGDYNNPDSIIDVIKAHSPSPFLNLVFIDPTDVSVPWQLTGGFMTTFQRNDFIINFLDGIDLKRNVMKAIKGSDSKIRAKYSGVLQHPENYFEDDDTC